MVRRGKGEQENAVRMSWGIQDAGDDCHAAEFVEIEWHCLH